MFKKNIFLLIILTILTIQISAIPIGEVIVLDIPWVLDMTDDGSVVVGGAEGGGGAYWTEETGVVIISATSEGSAISENGIIAGEDIVLAIRNNRNKTMSAHHILEVEKLPRVWLFAN